jgi:hypothetical protein
LEELYAITDRDRGELTTEEHQAIVEFERSEVGLVRALSALEALQYYYHTQLNSERIQRDKEHKAKIVKVPMRKDGKPREVKVLVEMMKQFDFSDEYRNYHDIMTREEMILGHNAIKAEYARSTKKAKGFGTY